MASFFPQWAQDLNTGLSFLGFCITVYVMLEVRFIKKSFLRRARLPEVIETLTITARELNDYLKQWPEQEKEVICQIKIAASLLRKAKEIVPNEDKQEIQKLLSRLEACSSTSPNTQLSENFCWHLWADIRSVVTSMEQLSKNLKWE